MKTEIPACSRKALGHTDKLRILIDKVLMRADHVMTEDHVRAVAEAGFNVVSPRWGGENMHEVRKIAQAAQKHGIYYVPVSI
jgi:2-keto-3-deoxy-6-phosphogluconate aldolase